MPSTIQRLAASTFRIERRGFEPFFVARCALGVSIALIGGFATGQPLLAVAAAMGAMSTGFASLQGVYRTRAATMLSMGLAMALSTVVGMLTSWSPLLTIVTLALWGFGYGVFASLGVPAAAVCVNATIALIVFNHFPAATGAPMWIAAGSVMAGCLIQTFLLVVLWPVQRYPLERKALATAYRALAEYARAFDFAHPTLLPAAALQSVRTTLADPRPFGRNATVAAFTTLLGEAERIRSSLGRIAARGSTTYDDHRAAIADVLNEIAHALETANAPTGESLANMLDTTPDDPLVALLYGQLRAAWRSATVPIRGVMVGNIGMLRTVFPDLDASRATLRANVWIDSPFGRHALRLAVVLALCALVVHLLHWQRGYWMTLTAVLVLRPDFTTTLSRGLARIAGTLVGVTVATVLVLALPNTPHLSLAFAILFATLGYAAFQMNYALYSLTVTAYVVFILALLGVPEHAAIVNRLIATLAGGTLAMVSYLLWPTWESEHTRKRIVELLEAARLYTRALLSGLIDPAQRDIRKLNTIRQHVWRARSAAQESLERMLSEPEQTHDMDANLAVATMAASQRIGLADLSSSSLYTERDVPAFPEAEPFARAVESAMAGVTMAIEHGTPPFAAQLLRDQQAALVHTIPADRYGRGTFLANADLLVDGINTLVDLWSKRGA